MQLFLQKYLDEVTNQKSNGRKQRIQTYSNSHFAEEASPPPNALNGPYPDTTVYSESMWYLFVLMMRMRKILLKSKILTSINEKGKKGEGRDILVKYFGFYNYKYNTHQY